MQYFAIFDKNVATIFQLQWNIGNISAMFLQYFVLCVCITSLHCVALFAVFYRDIDLLLFDVILGKDKSIVTSTILGN